MLLKIAAAAAALAAVAEAQTMPRCKLGNVDVSCIAMGTLHLHEAETPAGVLEKINAALTAGITTWDLSDVYNSMPALFGAGLQLQPSLRGHLQVIAKMDIVSAWPNGFGFDSGSSYDTSASHMNAVLQTYLTELNTTYIDVVLLHRQDYLLDIHEVASTVKGWMDQGLVKGFGVSNFDKDSFATLNAVVPLVANELELSVLHPQPIIDGTVSFHYGQGNVQILAWGPLGGDPWGGDNRLFGVGSIDGTQHNARLHAGLGTVAQALGVGQDTVAVAWLLRHPAPIIPIIGTMNETRMVSQGIGAIQAAQNMTRAMWYHIADAAGIPIY